MISNLLLRLYGLGVVTRPNSELLLKLRIISTVGMTPSTRDQPDARPLPAQDSTAQKDEDNIHTFSGIRTHDINVEAIKAYASNRAATKTGIISNFMYLFMHTCLWFI
jgi:hypothetical protein